MKRPDVLSIKSHDAAKVRTISDGEELPSRLRLIYQKYKICAFRNKILYSFCKDLFKAVGAEQALFFLVKYFGENDFALQIYPPAANENTHPVLLQNSSYVGELFLKSIGFVAIEDRYSDNFMHLLQSSGLKIENTAKLYALPIRKKAKLIGLFLFINPVFLEKNFFNQKNRTDKLVRLAQRVIEGEITELEHQQEILERNILLRLAQKISSSLQLETVLETIIDSLRQVVPYDSAVIFLLNQKTGDIEYEIARGYPGNYSQYLRLKIGQGLSGWVAKTGKPIIVADVRKDARYFKVDQRTRSELAVPIKIGRKILGVFNLESRNINSFTLHQADLLEAFAGSAAIAIQNARLYNLALEKGEMEKDLQVARKIQVALLPHRLPHSRHIYLSAYNKPSKKVGGDLYDAIRLADGKIVIAVGDVSGKGVSGALLMAALHTIYRTELRRGLSAHKLMARVNRLFSEKTTVGNFATFFHAIINPMQDRIEYCSAGHNPAILMKEDGSYQLLQSTGMILGFLKHTNFASRTVPFEAGDVLVAYSDGIVEAENKREELFGKERLIEVVRDLHFQSPAKIKDGILEALESFCAEGRIEDDITLLIVKNQKKRHSPL